MRGVVCLGNRTVELREFPDPTPGPQEVIIEMRASGLCGSDLNPYRGPYDPNRLKAFGHEPCGLVAELGSEVHNLKVGDRVMVHHYFGCGRCKWCLAGYSQMCIDPELYRKVGHAAPYFYYGGTTHHGGHADRIPVRESACVPMPEGLSWEEGAAIACGTGTAYMAVKRLGVSGRDTFAVYGQGPVGISATLFGVTSGARVISVEPLEYRRNLAKSVGCEFTINPLETDPVETIKKLTHGEGADATLDCTGLPEPRAQMVKSTNIFGRACFVGEGPSIAPILNPSADIIHKQLTIYGSWTMSSLGLAEIANYVVDHKVQLKNIITHRFRLEQAVEAYKLFDTRQTGKVIITWPERH